MRLVYLPVNQVWAFKFGDALVRLHLPENLGPADLFYREVGSATRVATLCGLRVGPGGEVTTIEEENSFEVVEQYYDIRERALNVTFRWCGKLHTCSIPELERLMSAEDVREYCVKNGKEVGP